MATRYTRNAKLKITDTMTADAIYNLERIDSLLDPQYTRGGNLRLGLGAPGVLSNDLDGDNYIDTGSGAAYKFTGGAWVYQFSYTISP